MEVVSKVSVAPTTSAVTAGEFNFQEYMMGRADDVNTALDQSLPMAYPESVHEVRRPLPARMVHERRERFDTDARSPAHRWPV